jgi:hypothetical protein
MFIGRGPKVFSLFGADGFSNSFFGPAPESWYPRCRYLRSDKKAPPANAHCPSLQRRAQAFLSRILIATDGNPTPAILL